jgi:hypothetical protein
MAAFEFGDPLTELLQRHAQLESLYGDTNSGNWLSGWQCDNPWIAKIKAEVEMRKSTIDQDKYYYLSEDATIFSSNSH